MSEYVLAAILLVITEEKEVYSVIFHSCIFKPIKLNYNLYNKELFAMFKAFYMWHHYLERLKLSIDIIMNHKNLEYFSTTKVLFYCQAR